MSDLAVSPDLVRNAAQDKHPVFERFHRREARFEREVFTRFIRPERRGDHSVRAEHDDEALFAIARIPNAGMAETGQPENKRERSRGNSEIS